METSGVAAKRPGVSAYYAAEVPKTEPVSLGFLDNPKPRPELPVSGDFSTPFLNGNAKLV